MVRSWIGKRHVRGSTASSLCKTTRPSPRAQSSISCRTLDLLSARRQPLIVEPRSISSFCTFPEHFALITSLLPQPAEQVLASASSIWWSKVSHNLNISALINFSLLILPPQLNPLCWRHTSPCSVVCSESPPWVSAGRECLIARLLSLRSHLRLAWSGVRSFTPLFRKLPSHR